MGSPTIFLLKTKKGAICGGLKTKDWSEEAGKVVDPKTFVFKMDRKTNSEVVILYKDDPTGFELGFNVL